jgi:hypothetical protein
MNYFRTLKYPQHLNRGNASYVICNVQVNSNTVRDLGGPMSGFQDHSDLPRAALYKLKKNR